MVCASLVDGLYSRFIKATSSSTLSGRKNNAPGAWSSRCTGRSEHSRGAPNNVASSTIAPRPSNFEGWMTAVAARISAICSSRGMTPRKRQYSLRPFSIYKAKQISERLRLPVIVWQSCERNDRRSRTSLFQVFQSAQHQHVIFMLKELVANKEEAFR